MRSRKLKIGLKEMTALEQVTAVSLILASPTIAFIITRTFFSTRDEGMTGKNFLTWFVLTCGLVIIEIFILGQFMPPSDPTLTGT